MKMDNIFRNTIGHEFDSDEDVGGGPVYLRMEMMMKMN
jgi:hypothetical protein